MIINRVFVRYQVGLACLWPLLLMPLALTGQAKEYTLDYSINSRLEYNDNIGMDEEDENDVSAVKVSLPATLTMRGDRLSADVTGEVSSSKYDDSGYNSDDQKLEGSTTYRFERGIISGRAGLRRSSTQDTEFLDTGEVGGSATRVESTSYGGGGNYQLTETNSLISGFGYLETNYESPRYIDGENIFGYAGMTHAWSERITLRLQGNASRYENEANLQIKSETMGIQAGFTAAPSENLSVSMLGGWVSADTEYSTNLPVAPTDDDNNTGYLIDGSINYRQERYSLEGKIVRRLSPSGNGYLTEYNQLDLSYRYKVSERSSIKLDLLGGSNAALDERINNDRTFAQARFSTKYQLLEFWYVTGTYTHRYQDKDRNDGEAQSNAVVVGLVYQPEKTMWSR